MIAQRRGKIINIASIAGLRGHSANCRDRLQLQRGRPHCIHPRSGVGVGYVRYSGERDCSGWFPSDMSQKVIERHREKLLASIPLGRLGNYRDLKGAAIFLASDASRFRHRAHSRSRWRTIRLKTGGHNVYEHSTHSFAFSASCGAAVCRQNCHRLRGQKIHLPAIR